VIARAVVDPRLVAAVATAPRLRRVMAVVPRSRVEAAVPRSAVSAPRSRRRATIVPCADKRWRPQDPEAVALSRSTSKRRPSSASSDGGTRGVRFEWCHGRCEVRAAMIAHDILRSGAVRVARMTTYICAYVVDDVLRRLPPPIRVFFSIIVFYAYLKRPNPLGLKCDTITSPRRLVNTFIHQMIPDLLKRDKPIKVAINFKSWSTTRDISSEWG
jgi:hypothetical protein